MTNNTNQKSKWIHHSGTFEKHYSGGSLDRTKEYKNLNRKCIISDIHLLGYTDKSLRLFIRFKTPSFIKANETKRKAFKKVYKQVCDNLQVGVEAVDMISGFLYINNISDPNKIIFYLDELDKFEPIYPLEIKEDICKTFGATKYLSKEKIINLIKNNTYWSNKIDDFIEYINKIPELMELIISQINDPILLLDIKLNKLNDNQKKLVLTKIIENIESNKLDIINIPNVLKELVILHNNDLIEQRNKLICLYLSDSNMSIGDDGNLILILLELIKKPINIEI